MQHADLGEGQGRRRRRRHGGPRGDREQGGDLGDREALGGPPKHGGWEALQALVKHFRKHPETNAQLPLFVVTVPPG